jgi:NAD(P)-dependent dehydrogenase (short-subunit alcohol dehydrogenase family)
MTSVNHNLSQRFPARRAFISGAASGLGLAIAEILAREGWRLLLTDVDGMRLSVVAARLAREGVAVAAEAADVRDDAVIGALIDSAATALGGLDVAVHCAGVALVGPFHHSSAADWQWQLDINVQGVANCCRAAVPHLVQSGGGLIINVASVAAFCTGANMAAYNTSKAAVVALSESLQMEYAENGLQVMAAMPGFFRTRLLESARGSAKILNAAQQMIQDSGLEAAAVADVLLANAARGRRYCVYPGKYLALWYLKRYAPWAFRRLLPLLMSRR